MSSKEFEDLKNLLSSMHTSLGKKIDESKVALEHKFTDLDNKFTNLASQVNTEIQSIKTTVTEFEKKIVNEIDSMNSTLKHHADRLDNTEDDMQRVQLSQDVRLIGFAVKENENLLDIFRKIADEIGFALGENVLMPILERMPTKNQTTGQMIPSPTIIIHFASVRQKQLFYSLYLNKMPLNPVKFGMTAENRIVVGEHLTLKNAQLFKSAQLLRKDNKIAQTFTENGIVKIRFVKGKKERTFAVRSRIELETIVQQNKMARSHTQTSNAQTNIIQSSDVASANNNGTLTTPAMAHNILQQQHQLNGTSINELSSVNGGEQRLAAKSTAAGIDDD